MSKERLELILYILLTINLISLILIICLPFETFSLIIEKLDTTIHFGSRRSRTNFKIGEDNIILIYKTIINGLTLFSCTCLFCLSHLVSKK